MKVLLVQQEGDKEFRVEVPDDAKITFGPFSPPNGDKAWRDSSKAVGTLRIYQGNKENIIAVFTGVSGFRDVSLNYAEKVAVEEGAKIWKTDQNGYEREEKVSKHYEWTDATETALLESPVVEEASTSRSKSRRKAS